MQKEKVMLNMHISKSSCCIAIYMIIEYIFPTK